MHETSDEMAVVRDIQLKILPILDRFDAVCRKHGIRYYLGFGSLIGAVRHHGYIPWDDDVDLIMTRDEYLRFRQVFSEMGPDIVIQDQDNSSDMFVTFPKVRSTADLGYIERDAENLTKNAGLYLDIFVLDYVPKKRSPVQWLVFAFMRGVSHMLDARQFWGVYPEAWRQVAHTIASWAPLSVYAALLKWSTHVWWKTDYVVCYAYMTWGAIPKAWLGDPVLADFEGRRLPIPHDADSVLRWWYGDYMQLPPPDQRVPHHSVQATGPTSVDSAS
ncbi:MAG: LicD family protein [Propionibacteriaceae bacterium]|nr:LicD family protein [Propionibacteriaceae bacterium]